MRIIDLFTRSRHYEITSFYSDGHKIVQTSRSRFGLVKAVDQIWDGYGWVSFKYNPYIEKIVVTRITKYRGGLQANKKIMEYA